jgi:hypothetical protein
MEKLKKSLDLVLIVTSIFLLIITLISLILLNKDRFYVEQNIEVISFEDRVYRLNTELHERNSDEVKVYWDEGDFYFVDSLKQIRLNEVEEVAKYKNKIFNTVEDE